MHRIAILDDHSIFVETLESFLEHSLKNVNIQSFTNPNIFLDDYAASKFDLLIVDLDMTPLSGVDVIKRVKELAINQKIIVLTMFFNETIVGELKVLGVNSVLPKNVPSEEFVAEIHKVIQSEEESSSNRNEGEFVSEVDLKFTLSHREIQIVKFLSQGYTNIEAAEHIGISVNTLKSHVKNVLKKLNCSNVAEAVSVVQKEGLIFFAD